MIFRATMVFLVLLAMVVAGTLAAYPAVLPEMISKPIVCRQ
jgi:hypothetical protein